MPAPATPPVVLLETASAVEQWATALASAPRTASASAPALASADAITAAVALGTLEINVLPSLQAWQAGGANWGWLLQPSGADGVDFPFAGAQ